jgi:hypothetical protein
VKGVTAAAEPATPTRRRRWRFTQSGGHPSATEGRTRVLLVGTDDWAVQKMAPSLERAGLEVLRCHEPGEPAFPCNALRPDRVCPLEIGFDAIVTMRARGLDALADGEFGVVCGLRTGKPLVVAGVAGDNPLAPWTAQVVERGGDVSSAVRTAIAAQE